MKLFIVPEMTFKGLYCWEPAARIKS